MKKGPPPSNGLRRTEDQPMESLGKELGSTGTGGFARTLSFPSLETDCRGIIALGRPRRPPNQSQDPSSDSLGWSQASACRYQWMLPAPLPQPSPAHSAAPTNTLQRRRGVNTSCAPGRPRAPDLAEPSRKLLLPRLSVHRRFSWGEGDLQNRKKATSLAET